MGFEFGEGEFFLRGEGVGDFFGGEVEEGEEG